MFVFRVFCCAWRLFSLFYMFGLCVVIVCLVGVFACVFGDLGLWCVVSLFTNSVDVCRFLICMICLGMIAFLFSLTVSLVVWLLLLKCCYCLFVVVMFVYLDLGLFWVGITWFVLWLRCFAVVSIAGLFGCFGWIGCWLVGVLILRVYCCCLCLAGCLLELEGEVWFMVYIWFWFLFVYMVFYGLVCLDAVLFCWVDC